MLDASACPAVTVCPRARMIVSNCPPLERLAKLVARSTRILSTSPPVRSAASNCCCAVLTACRAIALRRLALAIQHADGWPLHQGTPESKPALMPEAPTR